MIIVDKNNEVYEYFNKSGLAERFSLVRLDESSFELSNGLSDELVVIHEVCLNNKVLFEKIKSFESIFVFTSTSPSSWELDSIIGLINNKTDIKVLSNLISRYDDMTRKSSILKSQLLTINNELSDVMGNVEVELLKIKKLYEVRTPKRVQDFKGIKVLCKYSAGESVGGEFFDIHKAKNNIFLLMSSTNSYLISSNILATFSELKELDYIDDDTLQSFLQNIISQTIKLNASKNKKIELEFAALMINPSSLEVSGYIIGDFEFKTSNFSALFENRMKYSYDEVSLKDAFVKSKISRGQRILSTSPGFNKNWSRLTPDFVIEELLANKRIKTLDILDEVFYQLKKELKQNQFLTFDASAVIMEVNENALHQA
ncbi:MAG: hypothetical protein N4A33_11155 [Bacteriovoracaceae bacterium]|jgi:hypothetical protein|nr:hypothetical protein [Bacteriovoracaceae bacterium]